MWLREASESKPPMTCRKRIDDVETGEKSLPRDESGGWPDCCPDGIRHEGGVTLNRALVRNVGTCRLDVKRDVQGRNPKDQRIDARHRDGATRSSGEVGESPMERRGRVIQLEAPVNRASGRSR